MELVRIWPSTGVTFQSFKAESGWTGERTAQGVLIFTSATPLMPGESVKFGVKMDSSSSGINWRALDADGNQIDIDKTFAGEISNEQPPPDCDSPGVIHPDCPPDVIPPKEDEPSVLPGSVFRIIPDRPNVGSTIRVVGDVLGQTGNLTFT